MSAVIDFAVNLNVRGFNWSHVVVSDRYFSEDAAKSIAESPNISRNNVRDTELIVMSDSDTNTTEENICRILCICTAVHQSDDNAELDN